VLAWEVAKADKRLEGARRPAAEEICQERHDCGQEVDMVAIGADDGPRIVVAVVIFVDPDKVSIHAKQELLRVGTTALLNCCRHRQNDNVARVSRRLAP
jgi:hypothetical protein